MDSIIRLANPYLIPDPTCMTTDCISAVATQNSTLLESSRKFSTSLALRKYCLPLQSSGYAIFLCHVLLVYVSFYPVLLDCNLVLGLGFGYARKAYIRTLDSRWVVFSFFPLYATTCIPFRPERIRLPQPKRAFRTNSPPNSLRCLPGYCALPPTIRTISFYFYVEISVAPCQKHLVITPKYPFLARKCLATHKTGGVPQTPSAQSLLRGHPHQSAQPHQANGRPMTMAHPDTPEEA